MDNNDSTKPQQTGGLKLMTVFIAVLALHVLVIGGFTVYHLMGSSGGDADVTTDKSHKVKTDGTSIADATAPDATADKTADATTPAPTDTVSTTGSTTPSAPAPASDTTTVTPADSTAPEVAATTATPATEPAPIPSVTPAPATPAQPAPLVVSDDSAPGLAPPPEPTPLAVVPSTAPSLAPAAMVASSSPSQAPVPSAPATPHDVPAPVPSIAPTPEPATTAISAATPSGPIVPPGEVASGPVHMPANAPKSDATTAVAQVEEHASASTHEAKKEFYTVKITDSYKKIAEAHHITVAQLKSANRIKDNVLHAGAKLIIPAAKTSVAKSGHEHESNVSASTAALSASPAPNATEHHHHFYTVAKGDTLKKIAKKFNVSASALKEVNNLSDTKVAVGEKLRIPSKETHATANTAPAPIRPIQAETRPAQVESQPVPIAQPASTPVTTPALAPEPQPRTPPSPELANMTF